MMPTTSQPSFTSGVRVETDRPATPHASLHRRAFVRRGFTMIEILTVVAILGILLTLTVVGLKSVGGNANEKQAKTVLEVMRSALSQAVPVDSPKTGDRFYGNYLVKEYSPSPATIPPPAPPLGGLSATTLAGETNTVNVIKYLSSNPAVKKQFESLPNQLRKSVSGVTVPVDPWGNEIKFVYGNLRYVQGDSLVVNPSLGGLGKMYSKSASQYWPGTGGYTPPAISGVTWTSRTVANPKELALQAPDKGCFWVSAGPDGNFETHDDNLYSFEGN